MLANVKKTKEDDEQFKDFFLQTPFEEEPQKEDDRRVMREMLSTMRELTDEVKQLRAQLEAKTQDPAVFVSEKPSELAAGSKDGVSETGAGTEGEPNKPEKKPNKVLSIISSVLFYGVLVAMVLGAFLMRSTSEGRPFMLAGFSAANVLTSSMEDVYPKGSLIITKSVDAKELKVGDDITFMVSETSSITHRIIGITENYQGTGARAFETKGTMNENPDKDMVAAANVVGKVVFHSKALGDFANFVRENWPFLLFFIAVIVGLVSFLKWNAKKIDADEEEREYKSKKEKPKTHTKNRASEPNRKEKENGSKKT